MSEVERNKGKLIPTGIDTEHYTEDDFDNLFENGFAEIDGEIYEVQWEVKRDTNSDYFADVNVNTDGSIDFHTMHYNGGGHWVEVVEYALNNKYGVLREGSLGDK